MKKSRKLRYYSDQRSWNTTLPRKLIKGFGWGTGMELSVEPEVMKIKDVEVVTGNLIITPVNHLFQLQGKKVFLAYLDLMEVQRKQEKKYKKKLYEHSRIPMFPTQFKKKYNDFFNNKYDEKTDVIRKRILIGMMEQRKIQKELDKLNKKIRIRKKGKPVRVIDEF